jgi:hypothetical protein
MFLQFSPTYRVYVQDLFGELDKARFARAPIIEVLRLRRIALERRMCIKNKLNMATLIIIAGLIFKRKEIQKFIRLLDIEKVRLDWSDWYYCLRRQGYNYRGIPFFQRLKEVQKIDKYH